MSNDIGLTVSFRSTEKDEVSKERDGGFVDSFDLFWSTIVINSFICYSQGS